MWAWLEPHDQYWRRVSTKMHSHLHTKDNVGCEEIMNALDECHARGFLYKATGGCNDIKREVNRCLSGERTKKSKNNRETALERRARIEAVWAKFDEGDFSALERFTKSK
ncbi:hypothetical protein PV04_09330 [Phialophora macrospora]|uniref:COX assembly mitochondrial protein n=1 Tax=Phialophora macrospora TaxID=1851006 RepID=A0A0D2FC06_9EURO|nr:hypothetical protein PV04_09330 [Phialophora macrospora]